MRPLTEEETQSVFEKLAKYIGDNIKLLIDRPDGNYCFRLHDERVYYVSEEIMRKATNIARENLVSLGTCIGKFTKTRRFRLHITALDFMAPYAKEYKYDNAFRVGGVLQLTKTGPPYKIWVKPAGEQSFLYGNHILKSGLGRITENTPQYQGVIVYSMNDLPLGFGATARSTQDCRRANPTDIICFHQADVGEYLRSEDTLT